MSRPLLSLVLAATVTLATGCGSATVSELPGAAEPPRSPSAATPAAGVTFPVGPGPEGIVIHDGTAAVALRDPAALALVDLDTRRVTRRIPLPGAPRHLGLASDGAALVPAETADRFLAVAIPSGPVTARAATGANPHDVAQGAGGVAVGDERGDSVTRVRDAGSPRRVAVATPPGGGAAR
ncbi:MAG: YncE family protein, partial [Baekduiaceae bacterium]